MIDLQIRDLTLPPNDDKHIDFITITNEQWSIIKLNIEMLKNHSNCELFSLEDLQKHDKQIRAEVIDEFAKELHKIMKEDGVCYERTIDKIAEQLRSKK